MTATPHPDDARQRPTRPWVGVGVVVFRGDAVLLVKRGRPPSEGEWGLPGGAQQLGETLFEAAVREVAEETGLTVQPRAILTALDSIHRTDDGAVDWHYTLIEVAASVPAGTGEPVAGDDADDAAWVPFTEVGDRVNWQVTRQIIADAFLHRHVWDQTQ